MMNELLGGSEHHHYRILQLSSLVSHHRDFAIRIVHGWLARIHYRGDTVSMAEDIVQSALVELCQLPDIPDLDDNQRRLLLWYTRRAWLSHWRSYHADKRIQNVESLPRLLDSDNSWEPLTLSTEDIACLHEEIDLVVQALKNLSDREREVVVSAAIGMYAESGARGATKEAVWRGRKKLAQILSGSGYTRTPTYSVVDNKKWKRVTTV